MTFSLLNTYAFRLSENTGLFDNSFAFLTEIASIFLIFLNTKNDGRE